MKKVISIILTLIFLFSFTACGSSTTTPTSSPEINVEDTYYTKVLEDCPIAVAGYVLDGVHVRKVGNILHASDILAEGRYKSNVLSEELSYEEYTAVFNDKNFVTISDEDAYKANRDAYVLPNSVSDRYEWEAKNNFNFTKYATYYLNNLEDFSYFTPNGLSVIFYDEDELAKEKLQEAILYNPYFSGKTGDNNVPELNGIYDYNTACNNLETEKAKLIDTVTKYLEQKYKGVDNGIEFSDYMLNYATFKDVQKFIKSQKLKDVEITVNATHANLISFHPFVDIEYTLTANGEDKVMHEVYFLEVDKVANDEFEFKIAYVADYSEDSKFSYETFREGEYAVGENFNWDPLNKISVAYNGYQGNGIVAHGLAEMY